MTQTQNRPRVGIPGPASQQVSETTTSLPPTWHEQTEHEAAVSYAQGYAAGYAAAEQAIALEITRALGVQPLDPHTVIRWLIAGVGLARTERPA